MKCSGIVSALMSLALALGATAGGVSAQRAQPPSAPAAGAATEYHLADLLISGAGRSGGRALALIEEDGYQGVRIGEGEGPPVTWLDRLESGDGVIEIEIRGKDVFQGSFPGVAFHAENDSTFEVVYLRPFNFRAADPVRRLHAVQYMSLPANPWPKLRKEQPKTFEKPVDPAPDPNRWVSLRLVIAGPQLEVYVGEGAEPDLVVQRLSTRTGGRIGLWSAGDFANLRVTPGS